MFDPLLFGGSLVVGVFNEFFILTHKSFQGLVVFISCFGIPRMPKKRYLERVAYRRESLNYA